MTDTKAPDVVREQVRERYAAAATTVTSGHGHASCCDDSGGCCGPTAVEVDDTFGSALYSARDRDSLPVTAVAASLGCGNPTAVAELREGETVLDLGSGGGIDVLLSAKRVGQSGFAYGVDMTDEMLDLARANAAKAGATNVEFLKGNIEDIPLPDGSVDVVISNCVINLSVDKPKVLTEMFRVLTPGGRIGISDVVAEDHLTPTERAARGSYVGCIAGALSRPNTWTVWPPPDLSTSLSGSPIRPPTVCTVRSSKPQSRARTHPRERHQGSRQCPDNVEASWRPPLMTAPVAAGPALRHRAVAELVGTAFLVAAVVGSGIAAQRLSPGDVGLQLLENAVATGAALTALIIALQPISSAFNPVVTALERLTRAITGRQALTIVAAQIAGGMVGVVVANLMFGEPTLSLSTTERAGAGRWLAEVVATAGLVLLITSLSRAGKSQLIGWAVGAYITAGYWFTSSTSFANPAVTIARMFSDTFAGIQPASVPMFLLAQVVGAAAGYGLGRAIHPRSTPTAITQENPNELQPTGTRSPER